jgi:hypothetical protein
MDNCAFFGFTKIDLPDGQPSPRPASIGQCSGWRVMRVGGRPVPRVISFDALTASDAPLTDPDLLRQVRLRYQ